MAGGQRPLWGARTHAIWLGSSVFDGARIFEGTAPDLDLHCARVNASAKTMFLKPSVSVEEWVGLTREGMKKFSPDTTSMSGRCTGPNGQDRWRCRGDPESTRFALTLYDSPMRKPDGFSITLSPFGGRHRNALRSMPRPDVFIRTTPVRCSRRRSRGFDNCLVCDMMGNVAELANSNVFMAKDGVLFTPIPNGTFLTGITRKRVIGLYSRRRRFGGGDRIAPCRLRRRR